MEGLQGIESASCIGAFYGYAILRNTETVRLGRQIRGEGQCNVPLIRRNRPGESGRNPPGCGLSLGHRRKLLAALCSREPEPAAAPAAAPPMLQDAWLESFRTDRAQGVIDADLDLGALLVLVSTLSYGYALLRDLFAEELDVSAVELDWRMNLGEERLDPERVLEALPAGALGDLR